MLQNAYLDAKIGVDSAENEPRKEHLSILALDLARLLLSAPDLVAGRRVLELGAGFHGLASPAASLPALNPADDCRASFSRKPKTKQNCFSLEICNDFVSSIEE